MKALSYAKELVTSEEEFRTWLSTHNIVVYYKEKKEKTGCDYEVTIYDSYVE